MHSKPTASPQTSDRMVSLRLRLDRLQRIYGVHEGAATVDRMERNIRRRRARIRVLDQRIDEAQQELRWLESEVTGLCMGYEMLLGEMIGQIERNHEAWSPVPVLGYRVWDLKSGGLFGMKVRWATPDMDAVCLYNEDNEDLPHSDGRCGRLGCGVYAVKDLHALLGKVLAGEAQGFAVGLVALSGKVVEHERGYRAAHAHVVALAASRAVDLVFTDDSGLIAEIFGGPWMIGSGSRREGTWRQVHDQIEQYLSERARRSQWTLANKSE